MLHPTCINTKKAKLGYYLVAMGVRMVAMGFSGNASQKNKHTISQTEIMNIFLSDQYTMLAGEKGLNVKPKRN